MRKLVLALLVLIPLLTTHSPAWAATEKVKVYYAGPHDRVWTALNLTPDFEFSSDISDAQIIFLNDALPDASLVKTQVESGAGLVILFGPEKETQAIQSLFPGLLKDAEARQGPLSLVSAQANGDVLLKEIVWNSAPQVRDRLSVSANFPGLTPIVMGFEDGSLALGSIEIGQGQAFLFTPFLGDANPQIQDWGYFNYLIYHLAMRAAGLSPLSFADYPASPVPHPGERLILIAILFSFLLLAVIAFLLVRRYSLAHPEALDSLVGNRAEFQHHQARTDWECVGFHRPLGGFLLAMMLGLLLFIPIIIYQNLILPVYILPSAQALGIWGRVVQFFEFLWLLFDVGTSAAFIKYFSELRVCDPRKAIQYSQIFVWWQALSGALQVASVTVVAGILGPRSVYALYSWSIIIHTLIQLPGFYQVFRHALMAWQRFDYAQILDLGAKTFLPILTQPLIVILMVWWGRSHPIFGTSMAGLLGMGLAAYGSEMLVFFLGLRMYSRLGYNARLIFMAHFDWATVKSAFRFGIFEMLGSIAWAAGQAVEILVTQHYLINYNEVWGNWVLAMNFVYAYQILQTLYNGVMPSISESISNARKTLSQYYSVMSYKWGGLISAYIGAVLLAVADRFILGASGPDFTRAARYALPLIIWGAIQYPSWVGDNVQLGANRPYLKAILITVEQVVRIVFVFLLLDRFQINALIIAYFIGLFSKNIAAYFVNDRLCFRQRFYSWQSLVAPCLAGVAQYAVLRWSTGLLWKGDQLTSVLIFLFGILFSYPLFAFFYGLFGGWDDATLAELEHASRLSSFMRPMANIFWRASLFGARFSPLHNRFPITIRPLAINEALSLTQERVEV